MLSPTAMRGPFPGASMHQGEQSAVAVGVSDGEGDPTAGTNLSLQALHGGLWVLLLSLLSLPLLCLEVAVFALQITQLGLP